MAETGDFRLHRGQWQALYDGLWRTLPSGDQEYLTSNFSGVRGSGASQVLLPFEEDTNATPTVRSSVEAILDQRTTNVENTNNESQELSALYEQHMGLPWPPYNINGTINHQLINSFLQSLRANDVAGWSEPKRFTIVDANGKTHVFGQAPGSTKAIDLGIVGEDPQASAVFETGPDGRTYIRQPDGELEVVPGQATTRGEGKIEFDPITQRNIIRQPDGSIQFAPEQRGTATTGTDETGRRFVTQPDGTRQYLDREYTPGVVSQGGYNLLQQPTGALSQLAPLPEPAGVETVGGMQFIRTSTGELMPLDNVMNRMMENMVVTGDLEGAAAIHAWQTRPSNQEYFDRALAYMRSPADQLVISAIARGQGLVSPPPEETIQRIGPQPDYLTEAFNMLQDQMQMGMPEGTQTFANTLAERAQAIELEAAELALERQREENNQLAISNSLNNEAAAIANEGASIANETAVIAAADTHVAASDSHTSSVLTNTATEAALNDMDQGSDDQGDDVQEDDGDVEETLDSRGVTFGEEVLGTTGPTGAAATIKAKEESDAAFQAAVDKYGELFTSGGNVTKLGTADYDPGPVWSAPEEDDPITTAEALASVGNLPMSSYASAPDPEPEPAPAPAPAPAPMPAPTYAPPEEAAPITTAEALASFGVAPSQMSSYAGTTPASTPASTDPFARRGRAGGGMVGKREMTMVGESGPELALFPHGTEIIPLDRQMQPSQVQRLRNRGVRGMQEGGIVFDSPLPLGIRQLQAGRSLGAPRGQLLRTAGIALPSAQARRRMLPGEREAFGELGRLAGIPEAEFQQELAITDPSGAPRTTNARMLPLSLRR